MKKNFIKSALSIVIIFMLYDKWVVLSGHQMTDTELTLIRGMGTAIAYVIWVFVPIIMVRAAFRKITSVFAGAKQASGPIQIK